MVGLVILICTFFITLLGIKRLYYGFSFYIRLPITCSEKNKMDRRVLPFMLLGGGASANGFMYTLDICNVLPNTYLKTSLGSAPGLSIVFTVILAVCYFAYLIMHRKEPCPEYRRRTFSDVQGQCQHYPGRKTPGNRHVGSSVYRCSGSGCNSTPTVNFKQYFYSRLPWESFGYCHTV